MAALDGARARFACANANCVINAGNEYLAVADAAGLGGLLDGFDSLVQHLIGKHDLDLYLRDWAVGTDTRTMADIVAFNQANAEKALRFGQDLFLAADATRGVMTVSHMLLPSLPKRLHAQAAAMTVVIVPA